MNLLITFLASFLIWFMFAGLFVLWFVDGKIKKEQVLHAIFAFILAWTIADIIKYFFPTLRPFLVNGAQTLVFFPEQNGSFPSGHTAAAFALAVTIWLHDKKVGTLFMGGALAIGFSRILANVHYPVDIVGGMVLGSILALVIEKFHLFAVFKRKY